MPNVVPKAQNSANVPVRSRETPTSPHCSDRSFENGARTESAEQPQFRILFLDDDKTARRLFLAAIDVCAKDSCEVLLADSTVDAIDICSRRTLDAVFISLSMKHSNLRAFVEELKQGLEASGNGSCSIIGCGSNAVQDDIKLCAGTSMVGLLPRAAPRELGEVMDWLCRGRHESEPYPFHDAQTLADWMFRETRSVVRPQSAQS